MGLGVYYMDITTGFLNAILEETIFRTPPPVYEHLAQLGNNIRLLKVLRSDIVEQMSWGTIRVHYNGIIRKLICVIPKMYLETMWIMN